jgi:hypothetical protein
MATKNAVLRLLLSVAQETGATPERTLDKSFPLSGFKATAARDLALATDASDTQVTFTNAALVVVVSRDYPFSLRLGSGETLLENLMIYAFAVADATDATALDALRLSGNGSNVANLTVYTIDETV